ncbi:hypothetical protein Tco_1547859 [Tanacetum coccineum]
MYYYSISMGFPKKAACFIRSLCLTAAVEFIGPWGTLEILAIWEKLGTVNGPLSGLNHADKIFKLELKRKLELFVGDMTVERANDELTPYFKHGPLQIGQCKNGSAITYDCTRGTKSGEESFIEICNNSDIIGVSAFASAHFFSTNNTDLEKKGSSQKIMFDSLKNLFSVGSTSFDNEVPRCGNLRNLQTMRVTDSLLRSAIQNKMSPTKIHKKVASISREIGSSSTAIKALASSRRRKSLLQKEYIVLSKNLITMDS